MSQTKAQLLDPTGDVTYSGHITGVGATFSGNLDVTGNVSVGGTLTKQDVTNVDSVGIITARKQIVMSQGYQLEWKNGSTYRSRIHGDSGNNFIIETGSSNTERLRVKDNGNTGIGTNNPTAPLDVYSSTAATNKDLLMVRSTTGAFGVQCSSIAAANPEWRLRTYSSEPIVLSPGNIEAVRIKANGKVGIGTDAIDANLSIHTNTPGENVFAIHADLGTNNNRTFNLYAPATDSGEAAYIFQTGNSMQFKVDSTESITIASNGRVGISSSIPQAQLDVAGTFINSRNINSTGDAGIMVAHTHRLGFDESGTRSWTVRATGGNLEVQSGDGNGSLKGASSGGVHDSKGNLRLIPSNAQTGSSIYELVADDAGKHILRSGGHVRLPSNVFAAGTPITVINNSASDINFIAGSGVTLYNTADAAVGQRTLAARGMATVLYTTAGANVNAYISGSGLS